MHATDRFIPGFVGWLLPALLACALVAVPADRTADAAPPEAPAPRAAGEREQAPPPAAAGQLAVLTREAYLTPPREIADAVLAARGEIVSLNNLSPDGRKFLVTRRDPLPSLDRLGCPCAHLAEMAFDPVACRARSLWVASAERFDLFFPTENRTVPVRTPAKARVGSPAWSPDGSKLAFLAFFPDATHLCVADAETGACRQLTTTPVLATLVSAVQWSADGKKLVTVLLPDDGKRPTPKPGVATEPKVRVTRDGKDPSRTYRYLLESPYQAALLEHLLTGQLAVIDAADGRVSKVGPPAMFRAVSAAPGADHFRVSTVKKPFSYFVPFARFGSTESAWDREGNTLAVLSDRALREKEPEPPVAPAPTTKGPKGARPTPAPDPKGDEPPARGTDNDPRRELAWRPDGKGLSFVQTESARKDDKKDEKAAQVDRLMQWLPPFGKDDTKVIFESPNRISGMQYSADCRWAFFTLTVGNQRQLTALDLTDGKTTYVINRGAGVEPKKGKGSPKKDDDSDDSDDDAGAGEQPPGSFGGFRGFGGPELLTRPLGGLTVVRVTEAGDVFLTGTSRAGGGPSRPYIDAVNIKSGKKSRLFEGKSDLSETIDGIDGDEVKRVFTTRQKSDVVPDSYMTEVANGKVTKLTSNVDRAPWFHKLKVERIRVTRADGFKFWVRVTTPPDAKGKLPALFWIYPREYADQAAYDARSGRGGGTPGAGGAGRFNSPNPRSVAILTLAGYAVVEPDIPIVGPAGRMNDNYVPDLRNSLWAVIDELDRRAIIDRDRLACGGHSYGAFSTANALAHTPFFKAGIAGDGCYNRTLTSMSFQAERRHLWEARETYLEMSPLLWADRINGALLMYHGMEDANVGTNPINSEALFAALDGLGKNAALYMYPYEGHGPIARETTLDMWARWVAWLDMYVKNPKKK